jgi:hypothetical protein
MINNTIHFWENIGERRICFSLVTFTESGRQVFRVYILRRGMVPDQIAVDAEGYGQYYKIDN